MPIVIRDKAMNQEAALRGRALLGLARFELFTGLCIFLPAWDLDYWQAWLFLAVFGACNLTITLYFLRHDPALIRRRMAVGAKAETRPRQKLLQGLAGLLVAALVILPGIDHRFGWSQVPAAAVWAAEAALVLAMSLIFLVFKSNTYTAATVVVEAGQTVVSSGPYRLVRHPMYLGAMLGFAAAPIALGSFYALSLALPLTVLMGLRLLDEEQHLAEQLPGYGDYQLRVRHRLIPGIW